jgi:flavin reductase (DIM6/NTAB) family NADH-FMN oxidoreductase RutF
MHKKIKLNKTDLKKVAGSFATGVTVITTRDKERGVAGMTASSFVSVSLDPPLISFYVDNNAKLIKQLTEGATIGISILASDQENVSNHFAGYPDPNLPIELEENNGFPLIKNALGWYITKAIQIIPTGDHHMALCSVEKLGRNEEKQPLLYFSGKYL